jgi:glycosyltransferase involved in cell wall biosynthesis
LPQANYVATVLHGLPQHSLAKGAGQGGYLAFLGRISPEKAPDAAIRIAAQAGMPLKIAAKVDRVDEEYFKTTIEPLLGSGNVEFIGEIREDQKSEFLGNAAALLFPIAWREPFGLVMIESMACGTPVVAFENGSVPEVLENGVTGFIVHDERQAVEAVGRAITLDRDRIRAEFDRRFTARRMAENYVSVYSRLAKAFRRAGAVHESERQNKFNADSLVTCDDAAIPAKRDIAAVAAAPRNGGLGVLQ